MEYIIKKYKSDPSIDFDKAQADIYNSVVKQYTGNVVTAEQIRKRVDRDKFDPNGMLYAFTSKNEPLAYIRYYVYPSGSLYIGYPWCTPNCPPEIQERLFTDLKTYVKKKNPSYTKAVMGMSDNLITPFHNFAKKHNFEKLHWENIYSIDVDKFSQFDLGEFTVREATLNDLNVIAAIAKEDIEFIGQEKILNEQEIKTYLRNEILKFENCALLMLNEIIIGAVSPLRNQIRNKMTVSLIKFESLSKKYSNQRLLLYLVLAKLFYKKGLRDQKIFVSKDSHQKDLLTQFEKVGFELVGGGTEYSVDL